MSAPAAGPTDFLVKLIGRHEVAERTTAFRFEKLHGWSFKAGQSLDMTLLNAQETDAEGNTHAFTIASAPQEEDLMIATRMRDTGFKHVLHALPLGTSVKIEGPFGDLTLHNNPARTAVFLAGGIGVTPFRSMAFRAAGEKLPHQIYLFFCNRRPEDAPFLEELIALQRDNPNFKLIPTMTQVERSQRHWEGESGRIDASMLSRHLHDMRSPIYYIAGPPGMVKGLRGVLNNWGVNDDDIRAEEFTGY